MSDGYVPDDVFDEDYLYFYEDWLSPERNAREAETIVRLAGLEPGAAVLDVPCGHGRISGRLAAAGCSVVGVDKSELFLVRAREEHPQVRFEPGDMRELAYEAEFDCVVNWFSSFGYFEPEENDAVLAGFARALRPGGRLVLEQLNPDALIRMLEATRTGVAGNVVERGSDLLVDRVSRSGERSQVERWMVRDGRVRKTGFSLELVDARQLEARLKDAGFAEVRLFGEDGAPFDPTGWRIIAIATR